MRPPSFPKAVLWVLFFGIILPVAGGVALDIFLKHPIWFYPPFHTLVEGGWVFTAFALAFLIVLSKDHRTNPVYGVWTLCALLGMGVLDLFHAVGTAGNSFIWLRSLSILAGGLFLSLTWVPSRGIPPRTAQWLPRLVVLMTAATAFFSIRFPETVPLMISDGNFSIMARGLNIAGGLLFLAAAVRFMTLYRARPDWLDLVMAGFCALSGAAGILLHYSHLWCPLWWWWHSLRLFAYFIVVCFIILFYRRVLEELRQVNELNETILATIPLAMDIVDEDGRILYMNRVMESAVGRDVVGERCWSVYKDDKSQCGDCPLKKGIPFAQVKILEVDGVLGGRTFEIFHAGMNYGGRKAVLEVFQDVTELKRGEKELERSNKELEQFAYVTSHDLQEPLRMVASYVQLLAKRYQGRLDVDADTFIGFAVDGAKRMQNLINDLLTFSRVGTRAREFALTDCEKVLDTALQNLQEAVVETRAEITRDPLPKVMADDIQIISVFQNLIANAIKFRKKDVVPRVHVSCRREDKEFLFSVADNGIGIAPEHYEKIFQIFQRLNLRDEYQGSGIGLAVCKKIIERHDGRIWVESAPDKGSVFYFSLPRS